MSATVVDVVLALAVVSYAVTGWRAGLVATLGSLTGFVGGALLGLWGLPRLLDATGAADGLPVTRGVLLVGAVLLAAGLGQWALGALAGHASTRLHGIRHARGVDGALGAVAASLVAVSVAWAVAAGLRPVLPTDWSRALAGSRVLTVVDELMPPAATSALARVRSGTPGFPQVFGALAREPIAPVVPPSESVKQTPAVAAARASVVRVESRATTCGRLEKGSGWVAAPGRVVTNAHVVAGASTITVSSAGTGRRREAQVVAIDPRLDLAVLSVPGLPVAPLPQGPDLRAGGDAVVAGFPLGGPYTVSSARVRQSLVAQGRDVYGRGDVQRRVYSMYATVKPGSSGGPVLDARGRVVGTVFARSLDDARTGYAMTASQTAAFVRSGVAASGPVDTGACTPG